MLRKKNKLWLNVFIPTTDTTREAISLYLFERGTAGIIEEADGLRAYFAADDPADVILTPIRQYLVSLSKLGHESQPQKIEYETIPDQDWNNEWKKSYHGFAISDQIYIKPSWEKRPAREYPCLIEIDPEMAFGTGTHATTRLCLKILEENLSAGNRILDIGTGTGILAIAAIKLGAGHAIAFDIDPVATATAIKNALKNSVIRDISFFTGTLAAVKMESWHHDIVLANVNRNEIVKILPLLKKMLHYPVRIVLSGILVEETGLLRSVLTEYGFAISQIITSEEWMACCINNAAYNRD